jgi:hypothetical protein
VEEGMRATIVTAPDYRSLLLVFTARRLFQKDNWIPTPQEKMDMNRRFAEVRVRLARERILGEPSVLQRVSSTIFLWKMVMTCCSVKC